MMTVTEKAAYLKGLAEMAHFDKETDEGKLITAMIDTIEEMALTIADLEDEIAILEEEIDEIDEDLGDVEEFLYDDDDCDCCCDDDCDCCDDECDCCDDDECDCCDDDEFYEVVCPTCDEKIVVDEDTMLKGKIKCPACGEELEFDYSGLEDGCCEDGCDCGCEHKD